jgi:hypothetical protein
MKLVSLVFLVIGFVALGLGIYMIAGGSLLTQLDSTTRTVLAILLILYGIFRLSTAIGGLKKKEAPTK